MRASRSLSSASTSTPRSESTDSAQEDDAREYRRELRLEDIEVYDTNLYEEWFPATITAHIKQLEDAIYPLSSMPFKTSFDEINQKFADTAGLAQIVSRAQDVVETVRKISDDLKNEAAWRTFWAGTLYRPLDDDPRLCMEQDLLFIQEPAHESSTPQVQDPGDASTTPQAQGPDRPSSFHPKYLQLREKPKPDIVVGFHLQGSIATTANPPFRAFWTTHKQINARALRSLWSNVISRLRPTPGKGTSLVYPCFLHEFKSQSGDLFGTANQLVESVAFALDQQEELRQLAGAPEEERMPVFGMVSCGQQVELWCGAYVGDKIQMGRWFELLEAIWPCRACALVKCTEALQSWMLNKYGPRIVAWLDLLWLKTTAGSTTIGSERA